MIAVHYRLVFLLICSLLLNNVIAESLFASNRPSISCPGPKSCAGGDTSGSVKNEDRIKSVNSTSAAKPNVGKNTQFKVTPNYSPLGCSDGSTLCENVTDYPHSLIQQLLDLDAISDKIPEKFDIDKRLKNASCHTQISKECYIDIHKCHERPWCPIQKKIMIPQVAKSQSNNWKYIVQNTNAGINQTVSQIVCSHECQNCTIPESECATSGYNLLCKQYYVLTKLLALKTIVELAHDWFFTSSECKCECFYN